MTLSSCLHDSLGLVIHRETFCVARKSSVERYQCWQYASPQDSSLCALVHRKFVSFEARIWMQNRQVRLYSPQEHIEQSHQYLNRCLGLIGLALVSCGTRAVAFRKQLSIAIDGVSHDIPPQRPSVRLLTTLTGAQESNTFFPVFLQIFRVLFCFLFTCFVVVYSPRHLSGHGKAVAARSSSSIAVVYIVDGLVYVGQTTSRPSAVK